MDVEARMGAEMARRSWWLVPLVVAVSGLAGGWDAALAALVGSGIAVAAMWGTGRALSWSARRSPQALGAMAMGGFLVRLVVLTGLVWIALRWLDLDVMGLAIGMGGTYVALLVLQARKELAAR